MGLTRRELDSGDLVCPNDFYPRVELSVTLYRLRQPRGQSARQFWQYLQDLYDQNLSPVG